MTRLDDFTDIAGARDDDDEGLFARDINGQLVRLDAPTEDDYSKTVTLQIDGQEVTVPLARPQEDAQGNIILDINGRTTPRYTTIYDAAVALYVKQPGDEAKIPIPVLCHQQHMNPVAVCRLCVVQIYGEKRGKRAAERKLLPACQHQVKNKMEVFTMNHKVKGEDGVEEPSEDATRVAAAVRSVTEFLTADHLKPAPDPAPKADLEPFNELGRMAERCGCDPAHNRFKRDLFNQPVPPAPPTPARETTALLPVAGRGDSQRGWLSGHKGVPPPPPPSTRDPAHSRGSAGVPVPLTVNGGSHRGNGAGNDAGNGAHGTPHHPGHWPVDRSSTVFLVDHSACILCDRCWRACDDVKKNNVIGRVGKGATAGIGFDLNDPMGQSTCVQCGECMVSCPTSAITFQPVAKEVAAGRGSHGGQRPKVQDSRGTEQVLTAAELTREPLFAQIPPKFLLWQEGLAVRRRLKPGDVLCRQGEPGNTAFLLRSGALQVTTWLTGDGQGGIKANASAETGGGLLRALTGLAGRSPKPTVSKTWPVKFDPAEPVILGEMACLSGTPRTADLTAAEESEVWEIRRNVLDRLMRSPANRKLLDKIYQGRALEAVLRGADLFQGMSNDEYAQYAEFLRPRLKFVRVSPEQLVFRQGDWADSLYLVRLGHVKVTISLGGVGADSFFRGPGTVIGEIGLLALSPEDAAKDAAALDAQIGRVLDDARTDEELSRALPAGRRTATCAALDHLELARLSRVDFLRLIKAFPVLRRRLIDLSLERLRRDNNPTPLMKEFIDYGLYQAQSLLALDLTRCTHCDECTRACIQQHGEASHGMHLTRLLRDGVHLGQFLVATSCRSCKDAYCMIGCPVDAIHRGKHQQIVIEDHCIGCGLCANNCPYGNIWIVPDERRAVEAPDPAHPGRTAVVYQDKASTCDLCDPAGAADEPLPRCVYACPHDAAHRMTGGELLQRVLSASGGAK